MLVELDDDCVDNIAYKSIKTSLESLKEDLEKVNATNKPQGVFTWDDYKVERTMLMEIISAHEKTLEWFKPS